MVAPASPFDRSEFDRGVEEIARLGFVPVYDDSVFAREDGHLFACCPQVKKPKDVERLWQGLRGGEVSVVSTDTCTFSREQKAMWNGDWTKIPMGLPGLETLLPLVYTHGVLGGRLTLALGQDATVALPGVPQIVTRTVFYIRNQIFTCPGFVA